MLIICCSFWPRFCTKYKKGELFQFYACVYVLIESNLFRTESGLNGNLLLVENSNRTKDSYNKTY